MTNYIQSLRKKVGHQPIISCVCGCLIFNKAGQVLLQRRSDDSLWGNLGGGIELGESVYETACREVKEESGLSVNTKDLSIFGIYSGESQHHVYPNGDEVYMINIVLQTNVYSGTLRKLSESRDLRFFDLDALPSRITHPFCDVKKRSVTIIKNAPCTRCIFYAIEIT